MAGSRAVLLVLAVVALAAAAALVASSTSAAPAAGGVDAQRAQVRELEAQLLDIDARAGAAAAAHATARARVAELERDIARTTADLKEARRGHRIAQARLADRLVALYSHEPPTMVEVLLGSGGIAGAVEAHRALEQVSANDDAIVRRFEDARRRLTASRAELVDDRRESAAQLAAAQTRMAQLDQLLAARRDVLAQAQTTLSAMVADEERREAAAIDAARRTALAADQARAERDLRAQAGGAPAAPAAPPSAPASVAPAPASPAAPSPAPAASGGVSEHLAAIAQCESGGNPRAVSPSGQYRGKYQFDVGTWQSLGGTGDPAAAPEAEQDRLAAALYAQRGAAPWPICGR